MKNLIAYKGFNADWTCRGMQFEIGKTYTHDGPIKLCENGFHACETPLDVWNYYPPIASKFAMVELGGVAESKSNDTKRVGSFMAIKAALDIAGLVNAQIEWTRKIAGDKNIASGNSSTAASSGDYSTAASSGDYSTAASSGDSSKAASSGYSSKAASSGDSSTAASSGDYSTAASSGYSSKAASSGYSSTAASSGNSSKAASSGDYSKAACDTNGFACVAGANGMAKGNAGSALSLGYVDGKKRLRIAVAYVGEDGIAPDTWYRVDSSGHFIAEES